MSNVAKAVQEQYGLRKQGKSSDKNEEKYADKRNHYEDHPPSSPIRQLKEMFKNDVSFTSCELTITGRYSCHVSVKGFGKFKGTGRNLKIARSTAAQRALAHIEEKRQRQQKQQ
ncbi:Endoribonuclease Dicer [Exaiptasia diaphana]|nr:Endoribonuclease Dicer [Exaiptasia diaphana]